MNKSILFLSIFLLFPLPSLHAGDLAERVSRLENQLALAQAANINNSSWQTKAFAAKAAFTILAVCTIKRYFMPAESTQDRAAIRHLERQGYEINPPQRQNGEPFSPLGLIGKLADHVGDFGLFLLGASCSLTKKALTLAAKVAIQ